ncbi:MAG TPA: Hsp70 family protein, partial [Spirochaetia bacterium]|nr:Hsp70 family protein [Spirochaetia bacterium]
MIRGILGIDFGTTNSLCAWIEDGRPQIVPNDRGSRTTPSVVALSHSGINSLSTTPAG